MTRVRPGRRGPIGTFLMPTLLAAVTVFGLVAGLVGEGAWNLVAGLCLLAPCGALGQLWRPRVQAAPKPLPAPTGAAKSRPHPRGPAPPNAERA